MHVVPGRGSGQCVSRRPRSGMDTCTPTNDNVAEEQKMPQMPRTHGHCTCHMAPDQSYTAVSHLDSTTWHTQLVRGKSNTPITTRNRLARTVEGQPLRTIPDQWTHVCGTHLCRRSSTDGRTPDHRCHSGKQRDCKIGPCPCAGTGPNGNSSVHNQDQNWREPTLPDCGNQQEQD